MLRLPLDGIRLVQAVSAKAQKYRSVPDWGQSLEMDHVARLDERILAVAVPLAGHSDLECPEIVQDLSVQIFQRISEQLAVLP